MTMAAPRQRIINLDQVLDEVDERLLATPAGRRALCRNDPLLFALLYCPHHLRGDETQGQITFAEFHADVVEHAKAWMVPIKKPMAQRDVYVAPRGTGKSTWFFLLLLLWAAAFRHKRFVAAFASTATQAQNHLATFRHELETNGLLREDFPGLCSPATRTNGASLADRQEMFIARCGFVFTARGIDSTTLGLKVEERRPDLLILDDIEPGEETYSLAQKDKRLGAITDSILPLNVFATVVIVGTVTMAGSIIHDAVKAILEADGDVAEWITDEKFTVHYYNAIQQNDDGTERSLWPDKWPLEWLQSIRHTRAYLKSYANDPMGADGAFWSPDDFAYGALEGLTAQLLAVDPAVTDKSSSDYTGLAIIGYKPPMWRKTQLGRELVEPGRCVVRDAWQVKLQPGAPLLARVNQILTAYPETVGILVETNQGGDVWKTIFGSLPVKFRWVHSSAPKEVRAARALAHYQRRLVLHEKRLPIAEQQMTSFPNAPHDDLVDAIGSGIEVFLGAKKRPAGAGSHSYL